jgi:hypothetical protein
MAKSRNSSRQGQTDPDVERGVSLSRTPSSRRPSPQEDLSPAGTFDTALTSPSTFEDSVRSPPTPQKIVFEHNVKSSASGSRSKNAGLLLGMTKPALGIATLIMLGTGGAAAFGWFKIPGLSSQIEELEAQVAVLSGEINRFSVLNNELNETVADFRDLNQDLNATVTQLEGIFYGLNDTNFDLVDRVEELVVENEIYSRLNQDLNTTATRLAKEVDFFEITLAKLVLENGALANLTGALQGLTSELGNLTVSQNDTLAQLYGVLDRVSTENLLLESLNNDLVTVVSFLNETSLGLDNSLQQITGFLADQIAANQVLVSESLENTYRQRVQSWDCDYRDHFREEPFAGNFNISITDLSGVVEYVNERVLSEICLDESDFEQFLLGEYPDGINSFRLIRGVSMYTTNALDFYFPEAGETGITPAVWAEASYDCQKLQTPFSWGTST